MKTINIVLDVSGSINENILTPAISLTDFGEFDKINFIQFSTQVEKFVRINDLKEIFINLHLTGGGTIIQSAVDFIVKNDLNKNKTFIISDFLADKPDYSVLGEYQLIEVGW